MFLLTLFLNVILIGFAVSFDIYKDVLLGLLSCDCSNVPEGLDVSEMKIYFHNFKNGLEQNYNLNGDTANNIYLRNDINPKQCVHIFVHGFEDSALGVDVEEYKCALKNFKCENGMKPLALFVDYSYYSTFIPVIGYSTAYSKLFKHLTSISNALGDFLVQLKEYTDYDNIVISGHGFGGHIAGKAAQRFADETDTVLPIVYAIDPLRPCFDNCPGIGVESGQAKTVVTFHCNAGELGTSLNLADYDFYSGDGTNQLDSDWLLSSLSSIASYNKCPAIVLQTIIKKDVWTATKCGNYHDYKNQLCVGNKQTIAGYGVIPESNPGVYYFQPSGDLECEYAVPNVNLDWASKYIRLPFWPFNSRQGSNKTDTI